MTRAPIQILAIPFVIGREITYGVLHRADMDVWQGVAGGAEGDEDPATAARRECAEELGTAHFDLIELSSMSMIPAANFAEPCTKHNSPFDGHLGRLLNRVAGLCRRFGPGGRHK